MKANSAIAPRRQRLQEETTNMSVTARLHRLFAADGKCFDVAIDHGFVIAQLGRNATRRAAAAR